jgi:amino acid adenylation domain-containing protein
MLIHERFQQAAEQFPDACALLAGDESLTYRACAARVDDLAQALAARLPAGSRVAINAYKSIDTIVMMLACLRAGLTYVPVDPSSPPVRRRFIVEDSAAQALVVDERTAGAWAAEPDLLASLALVVQLRPVAQPAIAALSVNELIGGAREPLRPARPNDLVYILYTSGSTGAPKGVMISHQNAAAFVEWGCAAFDLGPGDRVAVHAPLHFDLPVFDLYVSLASGATVCPISEKTVLFPEALLGFLRQNAISVLYAVPSALTALIQRSTLAANPLPSLRLLLYAGEEFHPAPLARLLQALPNARCFNLYGPIETNVVTMCEVAPAHLDGQRIPLGGAIFNATIFLIDASGQAIIAPDQDGEIVVSGPSVSPGYLNQPERTASTRIVVSARGRQWPCYRTGDFARYDAAGVLHFLGRRDALIKTRGFRVDLGDVESTLMQHPDVAEVGVVAQPHPDYTNLLYGFAAPKPGRTLDALALLIWCRERLPPYMVPAQITICDQLPKTSTGKIARRELAPSQPLAIERGAS